jgi:CO/xanthine dehydrogenase FAD-binding subunit
VGSYLRPASLPEALEALALGLAEGQPRTVIAGATDHYPARVGRVVDEDIVDLSGLDGYGEVVEVDGGWRIPAGVTWTGLVEQPLPACFGGLKLAAGAIGGLQIQNQATIAGNVCNASPAADGLPNLLALEAVVELVSTRGARRIPVAEFVTGNRATVRLRDELVAGLFVPDPVPTAGHSAKSTFLKLGARAYLVISIAMVGVVLVVDTDRRITSARIAVGACSAVAQRLGALEAELAGQRLVPGIGGQVRADHLAGLSPIDDVRATATYRLEAAGVLVRRALEELAA